MVHIGCQGSIGKQRRQKTQLADLQKLSNCHKHDNHIIIAIIFVSTNGPNSYHVIYNKSICGRLANYVLLSPSVSLSYLHLQCPTWHFWWLHPNVQQLPMFGDQPLSFGKYTVVMCPPERNSQARKSIVHPRVLFIDFLLDISPKSSCKGFLASTGSRYFKVPICAYIIFTSPQTPGQVKKPFSGRILYIVCWLMTHLTTVITTVNSSYN